ncbi:aminotransferase class I/II-fold pyridoxal phosphate-dependent enzyme [Tindallia californiensis]|uniref:Arginine decarboxylase n=1 Tax=Tindallia californiensis TaxID=159292 RepID=A0A1H3QNW8_9FIRM|nr:aminotransferase class I/II-fold pyridoxal phosphate-dependent enzyme [Tindallia californiensis]SDZ14708.1 arginine decarboxylase [Tindallia californiensis]
MIPLNHQRAPLFEALLTYVNNETIPFHVPGHKKGVGMDQAFREFIGTNAMAIDVTVFEQVDSLHHPSGCIAEAQKLAADAFQATHTFFCVHGTSGALHAMVLSVLREGDKIILPRNVHKSVTTGLALVGALPIYIHPEIDSLTGTALNVTPATVEKALQDHPDARGVLVINPTYFGVAADLKAIAKLVHQHNIPLMVDEAHGPHLSFHKDLPMSAMEAGADICAQSTHKIIGSLTQSSMLHVQGERVDHRKVQAALNLLHTTSPSYILLASLDVARRQMMTEGFQLLERIQFLSHQARERINAIDGFHCFGAENLGSPGFYGLDPAKLTITCRNLGISGHQLEEILSKEYHIQPELSDLYNVLCTLSIGNTQEQVDSLISALQSIRKGYGQSPILSCSETDNVILPPLPLQKLSPREAMHGDTHLLPLWESIHHISAEFLMVYPPGIPLLCPGELISEELVRYIETQREAGLWIQGTEDPRVRHIRIVQASHQ